MADQPLSKKAKKKLKEKLSSSSSADPGNVTLPTLVSLPSDPVVPFGSGPLAPVPLDREVYSAAEVVDPLRYQVTKSLGSEMDTLEENPFQENSNLSSQPPLVPTPNLYVHQNVTPPQVAGGDPCIEPHDLPVDHSISVVATQSSISSLNTGYTLDWHHFLTVSNEEPDSNSEICQEVNVNFNTEPTSTIENNEASSHQPDMSTLHQELYQNSSITLHDTLVSLLSFAQSSHLSGVDFCKLLDLCHLLLPAPNLLPSSKHSFFKYFEDVDTELNSFFYCNVCWKRRRSGRDKCDCPKSKINYFITCPLVSQIQKLYQRPGFKEKLNYKFTRRKHNPANIEDIYDGQVYKEAERTFLSDPNNISLSWYTDGVSIYECSSYSLWVFLFVINELPPEERFKPENLIIGGLWGDSEKPHPNVFLLPIYQEVCKIKEGFNVQCNSEEIQVKVIVLCGTCDVPAKAAFMNMKGHSGYFSCPKCFIKGEKSERTENVLVFPHQEQLDLRNDQNYRNCVERSIADKAECRGVVGPSVLSFMVHSDFISSVSIDGMHCLYIGLTKQILNLLFNSKYSKLPFSLTSKIAEVNSRLRLLQFPHFVQRLPEDVTKLAFWKASLCRTFLLYLALVVFRGIMKQQYYDNLILLVNSLTILNSSSISVADLQKVNRDLCTFCDGFQNLYGVRHMSSNLHLLRHLSSSVSDTGNLFISSCFRFEDLNGKLADLAHGTRHAVMQIASNFHVLTQLPILISNVSNDGAKLFCKKVIGRSYQLKFTERISNSSFVVGEFDSTPQHSEATTEMCTVLYQVPFVIKTFSRLHHKGLLYVSNSYDKGTRVSYFCKYNIGVRPLHGKILTFVKTTADSVSRYFALIVRSGELPSGLDRYVLVNTDSQDVDLVPIENLVTVSFYLQVDMQHYVVDPLNTF